MAITDYLPQRMRDWFEDRASNKAMEMNYANYDALHRPNPNPEMEAWLSDATPGTPEWDKIVGYGRAEQHLAALKDAAWEGVQQAEGADPAMTSQVRNTIERHYGKIEPGMPLADTAEFGTRPHGMNTFVDMVDKAARTMVDDHTISLATQAQEALQAKRPLTGAEQAAWIDYATVLQVERDDKGHSQDRHDQTRAYMTEVVNNAQKSLLARQNLDGPPLANRPDPSRREAVLTEIYGAEIAANMIAGRASENERAKQSWARDAGESYMAELANRQHVRATQEQRDAGRAAAPTPPQAAQMDTRRGEMQQSRDTGMER
jgi:hypothetical protein